MSTLQSPPRQQWLLAVEGMHCASCVAHVEAALQRVPGVTEAHVNLALREARVAGDAERVSPEQLIEAVERSGYRASHPESSGPETSGTRPASSAESREQSLWLVRTLLGAGLLALIFAAHRVFSDHATALGISWTAATVLQVVVGGSFLRAAIVQLRHRLVTMDTLVALGTTAAYLAATLGMLSGRHSMYLHEAGMILTVISLGRYLESRAKHRASRAISALLELAPAVAQWQVEGELLEVPVARLAAGDTIVVRPGDRVPLDAVILAGHSALDTSWLTGESLPVELGPGDEIMAGSLNGIGSLVARVLRPATDSAVARIAELVRQAQESKTAVQRLADRVVAWFVPVVLLIAAGTWIVWALIGNWTQGTAAAVAVLVAACPCALGLAAPMAVLVAGGLGARRGIFLRNAAALEAAQALDAVLLDKTGTVTRGDLRLTTNEPSGSLTPDELLAVAAAAEQHSSHPLAECLVRPAHEQKLQLATASRLEVVPGGGVAARVGDLDVLVGNERLLAERNVRVHAATIARLNTLRSDGQTPLLVAVDGQLAGILAVADTIAPEAAQAIAELRQLGLAVRLISGDARVAVEAVALQAGLTREETLAEVLPAGKQAVVAQWQAEGRRVAMVGDGINDAPALAAADLGIAIGTGADVAIEAADVVLVRRDLALVPQAIHLARATLRTIRVNLVWALLFNALLIPAAALGRVPPAAAAAAMAASSLLVVSNSLLLGWRFREE